MPKLSDLSTQFGYENLPVSQLDADIPVLAGMQRQGDLLVVPGTLPDWFVHDAQPAAGVTVAGSEFTENQHTLHGDGLVCPNLGRTFDDPVAWYLRVPEGGEAFLMHSEEHGALGIAAGDYEIRLQREWESGFGWIEASD